MTVEAATPGAVRSAVLVALFAALTAAGAFMRIPVPIGVPFTLQVPAVLLAGVLLGPGRGAASQAAYVACGLLGLPVFATGGGPGYVLAPTFGFLVGFVLAAAVSGLAVGSLARAPIWRVGAAMALGVATIYAVGIPWFAANMAFVVGKPVPGKALATLGLLLVLDLAKAVLLLPVVRTIRARGGLLPQGS